MTTFFSKKNNANSKVATVGGIDNSTDPVTFAVTTGEGSKFPASNFKITIDNEILLCTSRTGDNLTCTRASEDTTIAAHTQNADVELRITAAQLVEYETAINLRALISDIAANNGWISAAETWAYVSVDDPTGVIRINADVTTKYSAGMRIKMTNGGSVIHGIITAVSAYGAVDAGYTHITFLHQIDPIDSLALVLMANSAITVNYYSTQKAPFGFPLNPNSWSLMYTTTANSEAPATAEAWANKNSALLSVPIGLWDLGYKTKGVYGYRNGTQVTLETTLSTANNSESDSDFTFAWNSYAGTATVFSIAASPSKNKIILLTSKTIYYLNYRVVEASTFIGAGSKTIIRATCAYL